MTLRGDATSALDAGCKSLCLLSSSSQNVKAIMPPIMYVTSMTKQQLNVRLKTRRGQRGCIEPRHSHKMNKPKRTQPTTSIAIIDGFFHPPLAPFERVKGIKIRLQEKPRRMSPNPERERVQPV